MLLAALLTGSLAYRLKDSARESARAAYRTKVLFDTNQLLQKSRTYDDVLQVMANQVILLLDKDIVIYPVKNGRIDNGYIYVNGCKLETRQLNIQNFINDGYKNN